MRRMYLEAIFWGRKMRIKKRDERLDRALGKTVIIEFTDGQRIMGILEWLSGKEEGRFKQVYRVGKIAFSKTQVRQFKVKGSEKWEKPIKNVRLNGHYMP